ncbi:MAG: hypothetical protein D6690_04380 [Nitrospirae bacterium]|nr:MAG: hypothetical protein D6690_04380 [Nitrospirota bacterium]
MAVMKISRTWWLMTMVALVVGGMVQGTGCAGRSFTSHGHVRLDRLGSDAADLPEPSWIAAAKETTRPSRLLMSDANASAHSNGGAIGKDFAEFAEVEPIDDGQSHIADTVPPTSGHAYWDDRRRAELMAAQQGIKDIHFPFASWRLTPEAKRILAANAEWLKHHPNAYVTIEGHCDERGTRAYNYILGKQRATIARNYLAALGVPPQRMIIQSYGKDQPICRQATEQCYAENRRAHFLLGVSVAAKTREK